MREIKFRAFKKSTNEMICWDELMQSDHLVDVLSRVYLEDVMQYTGLKDKNGVEIYEGDILRIPAESEWDETSYSAFEVFYHDNDATPTDVGLVFGRMKNYGSVAGGYCGYKLIPQTMKLFIVIGNIHENPGLLEIPE